jgi:hypothetical protein
MTDNKKRCTHCNGNGYKMETRTKLDNSSSLMMGTALGIGYFPQYRTVTERVQCSWCFGRGER